MNIRSWLLWECAAWWRKVERDTYFDKSSGLSEWLVLLAADGNIDSNSASPKASSLSV